MRTPNFVFSLALAITVIAGPLHSASQAQAAPGQRPPTAEEIVRLVRYSQAAEEQSFTGNFRPRRISAKQIPLKLTMSAQTVRFVFFEGNRRNKPVDQIVELKLLQNRYEVSEITKGKAGKLPAARFGERIRDTDITFEDLAMRFLYWPKPRLLGEERAKGGDAWKVRCTNPLKDGSYGVVDVWVSKKSGALVKMHGFNRAGKLVKSFEVEKVHRHEGSWILEQMNVRTHDPAKGGKVIGTTYLEIDRPR